MSDPGRLYNRRRARRSVFDTVLFRVASQVATVLSYIVMVRGLSEHEFGVFNLLYSVIPLISTLASLGLEQTLRRYQPEYLRASKPEAAARLVRVVASTRFLSSVLAAGGLLLAWNHIAPFFQLTPYRYEFAIFSLVILLHFQARVLQLSLASHMLHRYSAGALAVLSLAKLIAYAALAATGALNLVTAILSDVAAYVIMYCGLYVAHRRHCRHAGAGAFRFEAAERRRLLRYGFYNNFNEAGALAINVRSDNFFIAALMNPVAVGAYSFYTRLRQMAFHILPVQTFENVIQPMFFAIPPDKAVERIPRYFTALVDVNLLLQMPMLAVTIVYHRELVEVLFGGKFIEHSVLMPVVFAFATINVISSPVTLVAQYAERAAVILASKMFALYNIVALLVLIPKAGVFGAAIATGSAEVAKNLFIWWHVRHAARWTNAGPMLIASVLVWGTFVGLALLLKMVVPAPAVVHLAAGAVLVGAGALVFVRVALSASDRELFATVLHGRESRLLKVLGIHPTN